MTCNQACAPIPPPPLLLHYFYSFQVHFAPANVVEFDQLSSIKLSELNTLYVQRLDVEPKLANADAILTAMSCTEPAYLIQITVAARKRELSASGVAAVQEALGVMYAGLGSADSLDATTSKAWKDKDPLPEVMYLVPSERFVSALC
jgi:hypothetical protein